MSIVLPFKSDSDVPIPTAVGAHPNGKVPGELLHPCGVRTFLMVEPAAGAMRAMVGAALRDGVILSATGTYRTFKQQEDLFLSRYKTSPKTSLGTKVWNDKTWFLQGGFMASTPGNSNHGLGLAIDLTNPIPTATLRWMSEHGPDFGYFNTVKSEPHHWSYCLGDDSPGDLAGELKRDTPDDGTGLIVDAPPAAPLDLGVGVDDPHRVRWLQTIIGERGWATVPVSGVFDAATEAGVKVMQRALGVPDHGRYEQQTAAVLAAFLSLQTATVPVTLIHDAPPAAPFDLGVGVDDPHRVRWLQAIIGERGWATVPVSGVFDAATEAGVKVMQRALGVPEDGSYGTATATALGAFLANAAGG